MFIYKVQAICLQYGLVLMTLQSYNNYLNILINYKKFFKKSFYLARFQCLCIESFGYL